MKKFSQFLFNLSGKFALVVLVLFLFLLLNSSIDTRQASAASFRFVAPSGNDDGDCSSSSTPCLTLQHAVNQSASGDTILVAGGTYTYDSSVYNPCPDWTNSVFCFINKNLTVLGGYSAGDWASPNPTQNVTVIDGQNAHRGVVAIGYNTPQTFYLRMEGFTIQNGRAQGPTGYDSSGIGGGMLVQHSAVTLKDMIFRDNQALGQHKSSGDGGWADGAGIRIESSPAGAVSHLQRVVFDNNKSIAGNGGDQGGIAFGALFVYNSAVVVEDAVFTNNLAQGGNATGSGTSKISGLQADALGGGISLENGSLDLQRVVVTDNEVRGGNASQIGGGAYGGGIFAEGTGSYVSSLTIADVYVANNHVIAGSASRGGNAAGGGMVATNTAVSIERIKVISNSAVGGSSTTQDVPGPGAGGGIYLFSIRSGIPRAYIDNMIVADNEASQGSGTLTAGNGGAGGLIIHGMDADIKHATIAGNRIVAPLILGQALVVQPWAIVGGELSADVNIYNSIIADHTGGGSLATAVTNQIGSTLSFHDGLFAGNTKNTNADDSPVTAGTYNGLSTMQTASSVNFIAPGSPNYNYYIRMDSSAKDRTTTSTILDDVDGNERPHGNGYDFGAYEYRPFNMSIGFGDEVLHLNWSQVSEMLSGGVDVYSVQVVCPQDGRPPDQGSCSQPFNVGGSTSITLTGLSNYEEYGILVQAYDSNENLIAASEYRTASPTDQLIFIPMVNR